MKIIGIVGSVNSKSINRGLLNAFKEVAPLGVEMENLEIGDLPLFSKDLEADLPDKVKSFKETAAKGGAFVIATPEYNRSVPGGLKNAIDWLSRPWDQNPFLGKPVLVVGASPSSLGTAVAQYHLKQILLHLNANVLGQPEFFVGNAMAKFKDGVLIDQKTKEHIISAFQTIVAAVIHSDKVK